jgi:tripartite ATP-independent transporter DctM subunit
MESSGLWMLAAVAALMIVTGLPAWVVLIGVALGFALLGAAVGAFSLSLMTALYPRLVGLLENDLLQALPLYVLMGALINRLPLADILFRAGSRVLAPTRCATPLAGLGLGVLLAPMSGSVGASVAMLSRTVYPRLEASGLPEERKVALLCVASTLGVVVPPSLVLILLGDAMLRAHTEASNATGLAGRIINTQDVFHGALVPAAVFLALCAGITWWVGRRKPMATGRLETVGRKEWITAIAATLLILALLAAVALGYLYAVEAAATGGVALAAYGVATRTLRRALLNEALQDTLVITGSLFALLVAATFFTLVQRAFGTDLWLAALFARLGHGIYPALLAVLLVLGLCALVLDAFEMIFVVVPLVIPPLLMRVPDATWVAVLTLLILQTSFLVPPFGYAVLMARSRVAGSVRTLALVRALAPYLAAQVLVLALVIALPQVLWRDSGAKANAPAAPAISDEAARALIEKQLEDAAR